MSESICKAWKPSPIHPQYYEVSDCGDVRNVTTGRILKPNVDKDGYLYYVLCYCGDRKTIKAHRLVAMTFIPNLERKPAVDHINGNRTDNRVENLRWVTNKENTNNPNTLPHLLKALEGRDHRAIGALRNFGRNQTEVLKDGEVIGRFASQQDAADFCGVSAGKVSACVNGSRKQTKGYSFRRVREYL